jgi:hypothetical protein
VPPSSPKSCHLWQNRAHRVSPALTLVRNTPRIQFGTTVLQVALVSQIPSSAEAEGLIRRSPLLYELRAETRRRRAVGYNMSWICVDGISPEALYEALDLAPTGETPDRWDLGLSHVPWAGATLKSGWCAVFGSDHSVLNLTMDTNCLERLPANSRSIVCSVMEIVTISSASLWQGGRQIWEIEHQGDLGITHLEASGDLPPEFADIRDIAMDKARAFLNRLESCKPGQWGDDDEWTGDSVFNVPIDTAAAITGFRHDNRDEDEDFFGNLQILAPVK